MTGQNTTGLPKTSDYFMPRGKMYFSPISASTGLATGVWEDVGNISALTITPNLEVVEHRTSRASVRAVDRQVVAGANPTLSFTFDEVNTANLARFLTGSEGTATNTNSTAITDLAITVDNHGRWYDIVDTNGDRVYNLSSVTVTDDNATPNPAVEGTDYLVDLVMGRIFVIVGSSVLAEGADMLVDTTGPASNTAMTEVQALLGCLPEVAVKFVEINANDGGAQGEWTFHKVSLTADGEVALIAEDDFVGLPMNGKVLYNEYAATTTALSGYMVYRTGDALGAVSC